MKNVELVTAAAIAEGLYTMEEALQAIQKDGCLPLFTFGEWKQRGYQVKKGSKAILRCKLWKLTKDKKEADQEEEAPRPQVWRLVNAYLFAPDQVKKIEA